MDTRQPFAAEVEIKVIRADGRVEQVPVVVRPWWRRLLRR